MKKKKPEYPLGIHARRLLLMALPMIILELLAFISFLLPLESMEIILHEGLIISFFDAIGRGMSFLGIGVFLLDYMEKKDRRRE